MASVSETLRETVLLAGREMQNQVEALDEEHIGTLDFGALADNLRSVSNKCIEAAAIAANVDKALDAK